MLKIRPRGATEGHTVAFDLLLHGASQGVMKFVHPHVVLFPPFEEMRQGRFCLASSTRCRGVGTWPSQGVSGDTMMALSCPEPNPFLVATKEPLMAALPHLPQGIGMDRLREVCPCPMQQYAKGDPKMCPHMLPAW